ncbi:hypothetical protein STTU_3222 [Streptomyces sp. Tu6071]|nr:hypothetical protein STTU_3222 [Streptomyces sp. Tu6071]
MPAPLGGRDRVAPGLGKRGVPRPSAGKDVGVQSDAPH